MDDEYVSDIPEQPYYGQAPLMHPDNSAWSDSASSVGKEDAVSFLSESAKDDLFASLGIAGPEALSLGEQAFDIVFSNVNDRVDKYAQRQGFTPLFQEDSDNLITKVSNKIDGASNWLEKHKKLTELVTGMVGGAFLTQEKRDAAEKLQQGRLNEQNNAARISQEQNAAFSASISGLRPRKPGLINQTPLKRLNGTRVFDNTGKVA